ncbi:MAG: carbon-nitrogen hydrolase family protein [Rhodocyclaceae bacterium]|nr:carbon-nitrogen hydrolase family protein [Rhodocyclaceae bacterium]MCE2981014.1 carbon-nitrogen hydrolase family protein [Betaproteobacteria bacterium]MCA3074361.1 carbon-nitrogen hydrolase family protein [Rhodocyclaceae bacterium]MCA3090768.1 carbon-nitrogen hydrolase family protein [Rhodocyclaceae bacterium]MCA3095553.1 carbon-nitrogen hydrolase family protein [Rhodocyclaceae bacterium]
MPIEPLPGALASRDAPLRQLPSGPFRVAAVQTVSGPDVASNLADCAALIAEAVDGGARLVGLPEYFAIIGMRDRDKVAAREIPGDGPIQQFLADTARRHGVWLIGGSVPLACDDPDKVWNASLVYDDRGNAVARYDKIHLFGFDNGREKYSEERTIAHGSRVVAVDSPFGRIGLSICYDLRFPELYRALGDVDLIFVPSAFTETTGAAHWEPLLRARAIENLAYVVAPAQGGVHPNGRETHGHSMVIDPWGRILAQRAKAPGVVLADIDPASQREVRTMLPALTHRTLHSV